jgi:hypothetical protein
MIGCQAMCGKPVAELSKEIGISREYVYQQKAKISEYAKSLDNDEPEVPILKMDKKTVDRMILSLTLDCQSPNEGIVRFFENAIREETVSAGYVSKVLAEAAERAQAYDDKVDLSGIKQGANDEIFQCGKPVLTGIDPESTYTYLLEEANDRTAETWSIYMEDRKSHGLELETSINDGGLGLMSGIPQVYPEIEIQADTFHAVYGMGKEISKLERKATSLIKNEYAIMENLAGKKPRAKNREKLMELRPKAAEAIRLYDNLIILLGCLKEMLGFSGYSMEESLFLSVWVLQEMEALAVTAPGLCKEITKVRKMLPSLLSFIGRLERGMETAAKETGLPVLGFQLMYRQLSSRPGSMEDSEMHCMQRLMLGERYGEARAEFERLLKRTKKASSLVENLNGRIRVFIEVKRIIPTRFFVLLKVYFNTRRYKRSRCRERVGRSPLELLTGNTQPDFFEALGY